MIKKFENMEKLGNYCKIISGYAFKSSDLAEGTDIPVIKIGNISNGQDVIIDNSTQFVTKDFLAIDSKYHINKGDILISLTGSHINQPNSMVGRSCRSYSNQEFLLNQRAGKVLPNNNADKDYLYYLLNTESFKFAISNRAYGAANQANISPRDIENIKWNFPPLPTQRRIASILSTYDALIQNYKRQIAALQSAASELYKEWFVRFRFPGYKNAKFDNGLPEGWKVETANKLFNITIGKTPPRAEPEWFSTSENDIKWVSISDMNQGSFIENTNEKLTQDAVNKFHVIVVPKDTVLLSFKLTIGKVSIAKNDICTNEAIAHFHLPNINWREYIYSFLCAFPYQKLGNTSAIGTAINSQIVKKMKIVIPNGHILNNFHKIVGVMFDKISSIGDQITNLTTQRDLLLPRLMSGKLSVE